MSPDLSTRALKCCQLQSTPGSSSSCTFHKTCYLEQGSLNLPEPQFPQFLEPELAVTYTWKGPVSMTQGRAARDGERLRAPEVLHQGARQKACPTPCQRSGTRSLRFLCQTSETSF